MKLTNFNLWGKLNNHLHLMPHVCVRRFDMIGTVGKFLETKQGLNEEKVLCCLLSCLLLWLVLPYTKTTILRIKYHIDS